jgi:hypothetical protein
MRPTRVEARALLIDALREAHCWQDELIRDPSCTIASIAVREKKTERSIRMTLSLSFLSQALVKAAIEGRLSRGFGVKRLMDLPMAWSDQWSALGLKAPPQTSSKLERLNHHPLRTSLLPPLRPVQIRRSLHRAGGHTSAALGNGILRPETRRRFQAQKAA